ncbi:hypothetical protein LTS17_006322 [Exophiala oligosperma]
MTGFTSLTTKFRADPSTSKITKRPRESLACNQCRKSKLRCDRAQPCGSCVKRDVATACSYHRPTPSNHSQNEGARSSSSVAEDRLMHLEAMVRELMEHQQQQSSLSSATEQKPTAAHAMPTKPRTPPSLPHDPVDLDLPTDASSSSPSSGGDSRYVGFTHWSAILDDIQELKVALTAPDEVSESTTAGTSSSTTSTPPRSALSGSAGDNDDDIIFGGASSFSLREILDQDLPPKVEIDRALAVYFRGETFVVPFVHTYQFQRQYREFWADPTKVNPLWLSMLLSICYMASLIGGFTGTSAAATTTITTTNSTTDASREGEEGDLIRRRRHRLHRAAARCLVLGSYRRHQPFALEALAIYGHCKNLGTLEPSREAGTILAIVVRMAYEMGYHRDPDHLAGQGRGHGRGHFTPFEAEMRRRFWAVLKQYDTMVSFQLGLPSSIVLENSDTKPPRHLLDADFNESTTHLPPSRSEEEPSRLLWFIVKDRMLALFSKVSRDALSFSERSEAEISELDREIRRVHSGIPEVLRSRALADSFTDSPFLIMTRFYIEFIHLKNLLVLHRKYMVKGNVFSTMACVEAAKSLVSQFVDMYKEQQNPEGQLYMERWMLNNFTMNDFLLGVMVLCLVVHLCRQRRLRKNWSRGGISGHTATTSTATTAAAAADDDNGGTNQYQSFAIELATQKEVFGLLEHSYDICLEKGPACRDAQRVSHAIRLTLDQHRHQQTKSEFKPTTTSDSSSTAQWINVPPPPQMLPASTNTSTSVNTNGVPLGGIHDFDHRTGIDNTDVTLFDFSESSLDTTLNLDPMLLGPEESGRPSTTWSNNNNTINDNNVIPTDTGLAFDSLNLVFNDLDDLNLNWMSNFDPQISDS